MKRAHHHDVAAIRDTQERKNDRNANDRRMGVTPNEAFAFRTCNRPHIRRHHCKPRTNIFGSEAFPHAQPLGSVNVNVFKRGIDVVQ